MATLGTLTLELSAPTDRLQQDIARSRSIAKQAAVEFGQIKPQWGIAASLHDEFRATRSIMQSQLRQIESELAGHQLKIGIKFDGDVFNTLNRQISGLNQQEIKVKVDDSRLSELNRHLSLKEQHLGEVLSKFRNNPILVNTDTRNLDNFERQLDRIYTKSSRNLGISGSNKIIIEGQIDTDKLSNQVSSAIAKGSKNSKSSIGVFDGILLGIGQSIGSSLTKSIKQEFGLDLAKSIKSLTKSFATPIKLFITENEEFKQQLQKAGITLENRFRQASYAIGDGIVAALEDNSGDIVAKINKIIKVATPGIKEQLISGSEDIKNIAPNVANAVFSGTNLNPYTAKVDEALRKRREQALVDRAIPLARERASEIINSGKNLNTGNSVKSDTQELIIATGGYAGARGLSGKRLKSLIKQQISDNSEVIWVQNKDSDIPKESMGRAGDKAKALATSLAKPNLRGYSNDAIEMAAQAMVALEKNPEIKIKFIGESGGGFAAEEAAKILQLAGYQNANYIGVGTPDFIGRLNAPGEKIISPDEYLGAENARLYGRLGLSNSQVSPQQILGVTGHPYEHYQESSPAELQNFLKGKPSQLNTKEVEQISDAARQFKQIDLESLDGKQLEVLAQQSYANLQTIRRHFLTASNEEVSNLKEIADVFENVYIKSSAEPKQMAQTRVILNRAKGLLPQLQETSGINSANQAAIAVKELQQVKKEFDQLYRKSVGTLGAKYRQISQELNGLIKEFSSPNIGIPKSSSQSQDTVIDLYVSINDVDLSDPWGENPKTIQEKKEDAFKKASKNLKRKNQSRKLNIPNETEQLINPFEITESSNDSALTTKPSSDLVEFANRFENAVIKFESAINKLSNYIDGEIQFPDPETPDGKTGALVPNTPPSRKELAQQWVKNQADQWILDPVQRASYQLSQQVGGTYQSLKKLEQAGFNSGLMPGASLAKSAITNIAFPVAAFGAASHLPLLGGAIGGAEGLLTSGVGNLMHVPIGELANMGTAAITSILTQSIGNIPGIGNTLAPQLAHAIAEAISSGAAGMSTTLAEILTPILGGKLLLGTGQQIATKALPGLVDSGNMQLSAGIDRQAMKALGDGRDILSMFGIEYIPPQGFLGAAKEMILNPGESIRKSMGWDEYADAIDVEWSPVTDKKALPPSKGILARQQTDIEKAMESAEKSFNQSITEVKTVIKQPYELRRRAGELSEKFNQARLGVAQLLQDNSDPNRIEKAAALGQVIQDMSSKAANEIATLNAEIKEILKDKTLSKRDRQMYTNARKTLSTVQGNIRKKPKLIEDLFSINVTEADISKEFAGRTELPQILDNGVNLPSIARILFRLNKNKESGFFNPGAIIEKLWEIGQTNIPNPFKKYTSKLPFRKNSTPFEFEIKTSSRQSNQVFSVTEDPWNSNSNPDEFTEVSDFIYTRQPKENRQSPIESTHEGEAKINFTTSALQKLASAGKLAFGAFAGFTILNIAIPAIASIGKAALETASNFEQLQLRMQTSTGSLQTGLSKFNSLRQQASSMGVSQSLALGAGSGFAATTLGGDLEGAPTDRITKDFLTLTQRMGMSQSTAKSAEIALKQILGKPRVSAEELNQLVESGGIANARAIGARSMGMSLSQFTKVLESGSGINSQKFVQGFLAQANADSLLISEQSLNTQQAKLTKLQSSVENLQLTIGQGIDPVFKAGLDVTSGAIDLLKKGIELGSKALIGFAITLIPQAINGLVGLGKAAIGTNLNLVGLGTTLLTLSAKFAAFYLAGEAIAYFTGKMRDSAEETNKQTDAIGKLIDNYNRLSDIKPEVPKSLPKNASDIWSDKAGFGGFVENTLYAADRFIAKPFFNFWELDEKTGKFQRGGDAKEKESRDRQKALEKLKQKLNDVKNTANLAIDENKKGELIDIDRQISRLNSQRSALSITGQSTESIQPKIKELMLRRDKILGGNSEISSAVDLSIKSLEGELSNINDLKNRPVPQITESDYNQQSKFLTEQLDNLKKTKLNLEAAIKSPLDDLSAWSRHLQSISTKFDDIVTKSQLIENNIGQSRNIQEQNFSITRGESDYQAFQSRQSGLQFQTNETKKVIEELTRSLNAKDPQAVNTIKQAYGINSNTSAAQIRLQSEAATSELDKQILNNLATIKEQEVKLSNLNTQLSEERKSTFRQIEGENREIRQYYLNLQRESSPQQTFYNTLIANISTNKNKFLQALTGLGSSLGDGFFNAIAEYLDSGRQQVEAQAEYLRRRREILNQYQDKKQELENRSYTTLLPTESTKPQPNTTSTGFVEPVSGVKSSGFGYRTHPVHGGRRFHAGTDYAVPVGTPIKAAGDGQIVFAGSKGGYGYTVDVKHGTGETTRYAHLSKINAEVGQQVRQGEVIALSGGAKGHPGSGTSTGAHLHFETRNAQGIPVNPQVRLAQRSTPIANPTSTSQTIVTASTYNPGGGGMQGKMLDAQGKRLAPEDYAVAIPGQNRLKGQIPYGSLVELNYGGKTVTAKVVDGGPYIPGRQLDMTTAAAKRLGFSGVGQVGVSLKQLPKGYDPNQSYYFGEATYKPKFDRRGNITIAEANKAINSVIPGDKSLSLSPSPIPRSADMLSQNRDLLKASKSLLDTNLQASLAEQDAQFQATVSNTELEDARKRDAIISEQRRTRKDARDRVRNQRQSVNSLFNPDTVQGKQLKEQQDLLDRIESTLDSLLDNQSELQNAVIKNDLVIKNLTAKPQLNDREKFALDKANELQPVLKTRLDEINKLVPQFQLTAKESRQQLDSQQSRENTRILNELKNSELDRTIQSKQIEREGLQDILKVQPFNEQAAARDRLLDLQIQFAQNTKDRNNQQLELDRQLQDGTLAVRFKDKEELNRYYREQKAKIDKSYQSKSQVLLQREQQEQSLFDLKLSDYRENLIFSNREQQIGGISAQVEQQQLADRGDAPFASITAINLKAKQSLEQEKLALDRKLSEYQKQLRDAEGNTKLQSDINGLIKQEKSNYEQRVSNINLQRDREVLEQQLQRSKALFDRRSQFVDIMTETRQARIEFGRSRGQETRDLELKTEYQRTQEDFNRRRFDLTQQRDAITGTTDDAVDARSKIDGMIESLNRLEEVRLSNIANQFDRFNQTLLETQKSTREVFGEFSLTGKFDWRKILRTPFQSISNQLLDSAVPNLFSGLFRSPQRPQNPIQSAMSAVGAIFGGKFEQGGIIGSGRGKADDQLILAQRGEGIVTHKGMDVLGEAGLKMLNLGLPPLPKFEMGGVVGGSNPAPLNLDQSRIDAIGGTTNNAVSINIDGGGVSGQGIDKRMVEGLRYVVTQELIRHKRSGSGLGSIG